MVRATFLSYPLSPRYLYLLLLLPLLPQYLDPCPDLCQPLTLTPTLALALTQTLTQILTQTLTLSLTQTLTQMRSLTLLCSQGMDWVEGCDLVQ